MKHHVGETKTLIGKDAKQKPIEEVFLRPGEECVGIYRELRTETDRIVVILQLNNSKRVRTSLPIGLMEEETIRKEFCSIKIGDTIGLLLIPHTKTPILIRKLRDAKTEPDQNFEDTKHTDAEVKHDA